MIDIEKLQALEEAATPRPWIHGYQDQRSIFADDAGPSFICTPGHDGDADLLVAVRNALPELLAEVRRLRKVHLAERLFIDEPTYGWEEFMEAVNLAGKVQCNRTE